MFKTWENFVGGFTIVPSKPLTWYIVEATLFFTSQGGLISSDVSHRKIKEMEVWEESLD
jgi:hypothetical protein